MSRVARFPDLSSRLPASLAANRISEELERCRFEHVAVTDLTESNPTQVGIPYPADILGPLADPAALRYEPQAFGLMRAREAVARDCARRVLSAVRAPDAARERGVGSLSSRVSPAVGDRRRVDSRGPGLDTRRDSRVT